MQKTHFFQGTPDQQTSTGKQYQDVKRRVKIAVDRYSSNEILLYLSLLHICQIYDIHILHVLCDHYFEGVFCHGNTAEVYRVSD